MEPSLAVNPGAKPTCLYFSIHEPTTRDSFAVYLNRLMPKTQFRVITWSAAPSGVPIHSTVEFRSLKSAKFGLKCVQKRGHGFDVSMTNLLKPNFESQLENFRESIKKKRHLLEQSHCSKIISLQEQLDVLKTSLGGKCSPAQFDRLSNEEKTVDERLQECTNHLLEFDRYCRDLLSTISHLKQSGERSKKALESLQKLRKAFGLECGRFVKALPIYARRDAILATVRSNQVSIVIGETGSGKSTQLVQYLHYSDFVGKGKIVCTQPRKVAAVTLAKHVSSEMGVAFGKEVGCKYGEQGGKSSDVTKVYFMTDHALLNECISDRNFSQYSCIVIDEAHERSLETDILLAFIKQCLPNRPDLRVIVTSATIDPKQFTDYFGGSCPVVYVSGRTFPVDVVWNPLKSEESPLQQDYVHNAVSMAAKLHHEDQAGDILVFLTGAAEIDHACEELTKEVGKSACVLPLYGKLQPDDQDKVHERSKVRKVIFATNVAETSVTIDGVSFIIDTGLAKEMHFDPQKNMNSLDLCLISQSSAEQRKGRAGRTCPGLCYRLYKQEEYDRMPEKTAPEIMRVHLTQAALKLYQLGVGNILHFDFVEHPSREALEKAVETLEFLDCVQDNKLTHIGQQIAQFPVDPQLAKVMLLGLDRGIPYEAAVAVAISSSGGFVFYRSEEVKDQSDRAVLQFYHDLGDHLTHLNVYWNWIQQKKETRTKWCVDNFINGKTMRLIQDALQEYARIFARHIRVPFPKRMPASLAEAEKHLPKVFFDVYARNVCVFLGNDRIGYMSDNLPGDALQIFPGSALPKMNVTPSYLVFEKTLKTSRKFLLNVTPVESDWVEKAVEAGRISDPMKVIQEYIVSPLYITHIGEQVFAKAFGTYQSKKQLEEQLQEAMGCPSELFALDYMWKTKGLLIIHASRTKHDIAKKVIDTRLKGIRTEMTERTTEHGLTKPDDSVRVILELGGSVQCVLLPLEFRTLQFQGMYDDEWFVLLPSRLSNFGPVASYKTKPAAQGTSCCNSYVTFKTPESALSAYESLQGKGNEPHSKWLGDVRVIAQRKQASGQVNDTFTLKVEWLRRNRQNFAFLDFKNEEDFDIATEHLLDNLGEVHGCNIKVKKSNVNINQFFLTSVPLLADENDIRMAVKNCLNQVQLQYDIKLGYDKSFETDKSHVESMKVEIEDIVAQNIPKYSFVVDVRHPKRQHPMYLAFIKFRNPSDGEDAIAYLRQQSVDGQCLSVKPLLYSSFIVPPSVYEMAKETVEEIRQEFKRKNVNVKVNEHVFSKWTHLTRCRIALESDDGNAFFAAKDLISAIVSPTVIHCDTPPLRYFLLQSHDQPKGDFEEILQDSSTLITLDQFNKEVRIYGTENNRHRAREEIYAKSSTLASGMMCEELSLKSYHPGVMKCLAMKFGYNLSKLPVHFGVTDVLEASLDVRRHALFLVCTQSGYDNVCQFIHDYCSTALSSATVALAVNIEERPSDCCSCLCPINPSAQFFRLEICGHVYCQVCIELQVAPTVIFIPLICAAENCGKPFVMADFDHLFKSTQLRRQHVVQVSVRSYLATNPDIVKNCITPDCKMIYKVTDSRKLFTCSLCSADICTSCHVQYHTGLTCQARKSESNADRTFLEFVKKDENTKLCPSCGCAIEKTYGCNHMICSQCNKHICWVCLQYFGSSQDCYAHLLRAHGSYV